MSKKLLHLFEIGSYFHLLIAESIIKQKRIAYEDCFFITVRGIKLPESLEGSLLIDETGMHYKDLFKKYREQKKWIKGLFEGKEVLYYTPFHLSFPSIWLYDKYNYIEEGFSAYSRRKLKNSYKGIVGEYLKWLGICLFFPFSNHNIKGLLMGWTGSRITPKRHVDIYTLDKEAYSGYNFGDNARTEVIPINISKKTDSSISNSLIIVMDRLTKQGRPFNDDVYLHILNKSIHSLQLPQNVYVKLHPADYANCDVKSIVEHNLKDIGVNPVFIETSLEDIAISNHHNVFLGTNSTLLFYAPILGKTNRSISFSRMLAQNDTKYKAFLQDWGGVDEFCNIFSKHVKCI